MASKFQVSGSQSAAIWESIFNRVSRHDISCPNANWVKGGTLHNCSRTCIYFRNMVARTKAEFLFWNILPLIFIRLEPSDIISCRQVCQIWKRAVDNLIENHMQYFHEFQSRYSCSRALILGSQSVAGGPFFDNQDYHWKSLADKVITKFCNVEKIQTFTREIGDFATFRFLGNSVKITCCIHKDSSLDHLFLHINYVKSALKLFFVKYGYNIRAISMKMLTEDKLSRQEILEFLSILQLTPNVRKLEIEFTDRSKESGAMELAEECECNAAFPELRYLESLKFDKHVDSAYFVFEQHIITNYSHKLKQLCVRLNWDSCFSLGYMPNLEKIDVIVSTVQQLSVLFAEDAECPNLYSVSAGISSKFLKAVSLSDFLQPLAKFGNSLESIVLSSSDSINVLECVYQEDLKLFKNFKVLKHFCGGNFYFHKCRILKYIPASVECLALTTRAKFEELSFHRNLCDNPILRFKALISKYCCLPYCNQSKCHTPNISRFEYVSADLPKIFSKGFCHKIYRKLPNLKLFVGIDIQEITYVLYEREQYERRQRKNVVGVHCA